MKRPCVDRFAYIFGLIFFMAAASLGQTEERDRGIQLYQAGQYEEAIVVLQKVVDAEPANKVAWTYLGGSLFHTGKKDEALEAFRKPMGGPPAPKLEKSIKVISQSRAGYTERARKNRVKGTVLLMTEFRSDSKIGFVVPIKELPDGLTENSVESAKSIKFAPGVKGGKPVTMIRLLSYSFETY